MRNILIAPLILLLLLATALSSCGPQPAGTEITIRVVATKNFGQELMFDETLRLLPGTSAMEALKQVAEVEAAYGGGFVNAINGVRSQYTGSGSAKEDWFFCVNGISANVGALDYTLYNGDVEHWDYHRWSFRMFTPAVIGQFPEPFLHGYGGQVRPTVVVYEDRLRTEAQALAEKLTQLGVESVSVQNISGLTEGDKQHSNLILLGTMDSDLVAELNRVWDRLGFFVRFEDDTMIVYDSRGEVEAEYGVGCGLIQATQSPWNPKGIGACENVVWVVSGTDEAGVKSAVNALINHYYDFQYACAVVIANGEIIRVPL